MASVKELEKLQPEQLAKLAQKHDIAVVEGDSVENTAKTIAAKITPEQLKEFRVAEGLDHPDDPKPTEIVSPQQGAPEEGKAVVVDNSAPVENNIADLKNGTREDEKEETPELSAQQPGDPTVKTNNGGVVTERDATEDDLKGVSAPSESQNEDEIVPANGDESGQVSDDNEDRTIQLENPSGKVVDVLESEVAKRHMFAAGFKLVEGKKYSAEVKAELDAHVARLKASGISDGVDRGDNGQSNYRADVERRRGTEGAKKVEEKKTTTPPAAPKTTPPARKTNSRTAKALGKK